MNTKDRRLAGSLLVAAVAAAILRSRSRAYRDLAALEERDSDADGIPDVYAATTQAPPIPAVRGSAPPRSHCSRHPTPAGTSDQNRQNRACLPRQAQGLRRDAELDEHR
jgi:hypothetical protein